MIGIYAAMNSGVFELVETACRLEVGAIKAGNVHPSASFSDVNHADFIHSSTIVADAWRQQPEANVGRWVLDAVIGVRNAVGKNTNLGIILLLAPLAKAAQLASSHEPYCGLATAQVLAGLDQHDSKQIYEAIHVAKPGGLNASDKYDVHNAAPKDLLDAMQIAATYDDIAKQYVTNFADVYTLGTRLSELLRSDWAMSDAITALQIERLAAHPDTLIARKCGFEIAEFVQIKACEVRDAGSYGSATYQLAWNSFDKYLRSDSNRLNPGTTADLIAAAIFVCLYQNPELYDSSTISR